MESIENLLGLDAEKLTAYQMAARAFVVFFISLILIRVAGIRTLGKQSSFDTVTSLMLGAIMARAIVTNQPFFESMFAALVLMLLHRFVAWITFKSSGVGKILKGNNILLMKDGKKQHKSMAQYHITEEDILETLRKDTNLTSLDKIKEVYLERSGEISIIKE